MFAVDLASGLAAASPARAASPLIKNGGFVLSGTFTQNGFNFPSHSGQQWIDLTGVTQTATGVSQTVATVAGIHYVVALSSGSTTISFINGDPSNDTLNSLDAA